MAAGYANFTPATRIAWRVHVQRLYHRMWEGAAVGSGTWPPAADAAAQARTGHDHLQCLHQRVRGGPVLGGAIATIAPSNCRLRLLRGFILMDFGGSDF